MEPESRRRYDQGLARGRLRLEPGEEHDSRRPTPPTAMLSIKSSRARPFADQAMRAFRAGDYRTAKLNLKMALAHEPDNPLLRARLAEVEQKLNPGE
jgi:Tfp pilus assembly protein PilF